MTTTSRSTRRLAPLTAMSVHQRLGWLDQFTHLICSSTTDGFVAGRKYEMQAKNLKASILTERVVSGQLEEILEVGSEMYVQVHDDLEMVFAELEITPVRQKALSAERRGNII